MRLPTVALASTTIIGIAIYQTATTGSPDAYTAASLFALAAGSGAGKAADAFVAAYTKKRPDDE